MRGLRRGQLANTKFTMPNTEISKSSRSITWGRASRSRSLTTSSGQPARTRPTLRGGGGGGEGPAAAAPAAAGVAAAVATSARRAEAAGAAAGGAAAAAAAAGAALPRDWWARRQ